MSQDISIRPYFIRAVYQWCMDEGHTPYLLANWSEDNPSAVPKRLANDGRIVFNLSTHAVRHLVVNAEGVFFTARFLGKTVEVEIPLADVISIYAKEKPSGITFPPLPPGESKGEGEGKAAEEKKPRRRKMTAADIKII